MATISSTKLLLTFCQIIFIVVPIIEKVQMKSIDQGRWKRSVETQNITWTSRQIKTIVITIKESRDELLDLTSQMINEEKIDNMTANMNVTLDGFPISDLPPLDDPGRFTSNITRTNLKNHEILSQVLDFVAQAYNHTSDYRVFRVKYGISKIMFVIEKNINIPSSMTQNDASNNTIFQPSSEADKNEWDFFVFKNSLKIFNNLLVQYTVILSDLS